MPQYFRTSTPMGDWRSFKFTLDVSESWVNGKLYLVNETVGLLFMGDIVYDPTTGYPIDPQVKEYGDECVLVYHIEKVMVNKEAGSGLSSFNPGDAIYWSGTNGDDVVSTWQSGYYWIGVCTAAAGALATQVEIDLKGDKATQGVMPT